jgi:glycine betaine transporter
MITFNVILHSTDFSAESDQAFDLACCIAREHCARLIVLHVLPPAADSNRDSDSVLLSEDSALSLRCREQFDRLKSLAGSTPLTFRVVLGYSVGMILNVARQEGVDLIVLASHGHSQSPFQLHGSVAEGVLRQAHCPVFCLRQPSSGGCTPGGIRRERVDALN